MTEKQISEEDLEAACEAYWNAQEAFHIDEPANMQLWQSLPAQLRRSTYEAMATTIQALQSRGWCRREDAALAPQTRSVRLMLYVDGEEYSLLEFVRALKETP